MFDKLKSLLGRGQRVNAHALVPTVTDSQARAQAAREQGNAHLAQDNFHEAARCYELAATLDPTDAATRINLGFSLCTLGLATQARPHLEQAVALQPHNHDAWYLLGTAQEQCADLAAAAKSFQQTIALQPAFELAYRDLCRVLSQSGQLQQARAVLDQGLSLNPGLADFHFYQGNLFMQEQDFTAAAACYQKALSIDPAQAQVRASLGQAHDRQGAWDLAAASYHQAIALGARDAQTFNLLGRAQARQGLAQAAVSSYEQAIALEPTLADAHSNLGDVLRIQGQLERAIQACTTAITLNPHLASAHNNLGAALSASGRQDQALQHLEIAVSLIPENATFRGNLGAVLQKQGALAAAVEQYRSALRLEPERLDTRSNLLFALSFSPGCSPSEYLDEARRYGQQLHASKVVPLRHFAVDATPGRALRVGFVSGDLRAHPVGFFLESTLTHIDPARIALFAYSTQPVVDELTQRIKPRFKGWRDVWGMSDEHAANLMMGDGLDILVDLAGHSEHNRLPLFALRPAPIQVSWLGYFASTGVAEMDYFLTDAVSSPDSTREHFSEKLWYLPHTRLCFTAPDLDATLACGPLPMLKNNFTTFGSFQNPSKLNSSVLETWAEILRALPSSRLRIQTLGANDNSLQKRLVASGLDLDRTSILSATGRLSYLKAHQQVDIILDTFPYPGGTTTCEALWMGVPTLTLAGQTLLARQGASLMNCAGLPDWVTNTRQEYIDSAVSHAKSPAELARLRSSLRASVLASPLFDARSFASDLSTAFENMRRV